MGDMGFSDSEIEEFKVKTERWVSQVDGAPSCTPCSLYNMMTELHKRPTAPLDIEPKYKTVCKLLEYSDNTGVAWDFIEPAMNRYLRKSKVRLWTFQIDQKDRSVPVEKLCRIAENKACSYPMMSLGPEYLRDEYSVELQGNPFSWPGHMVVILGCSKEACAIHDPYARQHRKESIRIISKERINKYWFSTNPPRSLAWFERGSRVLEEFGGTER